MVTLPGPSVNPSPSLPKYELAGLKPSFDTAWPCNMGSECSRTAKAREGAERDTVLVGAPWLGSCIYPLEDAQGTL